MPYDIDIYIKVGFYCLGVLIGVVLGFACWYFIWKKL